MPRRRCLQACLCLILALTGAGTFLVGCQANPWPAKVPKLGHSEGLLQHGCRYAPGWHGHPKPRCDCKCKYDETPFWARDQLTGEKKEFASKCQLECCNCLFKTHFKPEKATRETKPQKLGLGNFQLRTKPKCDADCYSKPGPAVCAVHKDDETKTMTFRNKCLLKFYNCLYGKTYKPVGHPMLRDKPLAKSRRDQEDRPNKKKHSTTLNSRTFM